MGPCALELIEFENNGFAVSLKTLIKLDKSVPGNGRCYILGVQSL